MNPRAKIHQERICGALLHVLLLAALFTVFAHAARPQASSRAANRVDQQSSSQRVNESGLQR